MPEEEEDFISLDAFEAELARDIPGMRRALEEEHERLAICQDTRDTLKSLRKSLGSTQADIAHALDMTQPAVSKLEAGDNDMGLMTLCRYAGALGLRPTISFVPTRTSYRYGDDQTAVIEALENLPLDLLPQSPHTLSDDSSADQSATYAPVAELASELDRALSQRLAAEIPRLVMAICQGLNRPSATAEA